jgi:hypothetical protein
MKPKKLQIDSYARNAAFAETKQFCYLSKEHDYIEITEWHNGEGWDINLSGSTEQTIAITHGQFDAIKKLIKQLNKQQ